MSDRTESLSVDAAAVPGLAPTPHLVLALQADRPLAGGVRLALDGLDEVRLGRAAGRALRRDGRALEVGLPDTRVSSAHARVARGARGWLVEDLGSKNGLAVNGKPVARAPLEDGDLVELGRTFLLFRSFAAAHGEPDVVEAEGTADGLATLQPELARALAALGAAGASAVPVLLHGETGTGKELAARAVHARSGRPGPLVAVNCGALPAALVASELFGYRKGAFSGADDDRPGLVRSADRGTLFLDEIADLNAEGQAALLRVLQEGEVLPLGATKPVPVDVRVVSASHHDLAARVAAGRFRADLLARLAGFTLALPPLRERREDLGLLVGAILRRRLPERAGALTLTGAAARALFRGAWPLNVRQLEHALLTAAALSPDGVLAPEPFQEPPPPSQGAGQGGRAPSGDTDEELARKLRSLLEEHRGNVSAVATALGKARMQVQRWMRRFGIDPETYRR
ncbi:MAG: sigma 54-interacting transcriptional regulator [Anaeromyxobacteraceae bacterium]